MKWREEEKSNPPRSENR